MPKRNIVQIKLPAEKPDCCATCPLVGLVPKHLRQHRSKETHVCLGTMEALTGRGIQVRASGRDSNHPLRRPCDNRWEAWMTLPGLKLHMKASKRNLKDITRKDDIAKYIEKHPEYVKPEKKD